MNVLLTEAQLREGVDRLAREIGQRYGQQPLTVVGILTGSLVLLADLIRLLSLPLRVGVVQARSYRGGQTQPGEIAVNAELLPQIAGRHVLLVDDIFDTGATLQRVRQLIEGLGPASVQTAVLLRKPARVEVVMQPDFVGFEVPEAWVVGYGLDYRDRFRNLRYIAELTAEERAAEDRASGEDGP